MALLPASRSELEAALTAAVQRRFGAGARVENLKQATLGGSNRTLLFDVVEGASRRRLVSREETFTGHTSPFLPPKTQYRILQLVYAAGAPVTEPVFAFDEQDTLGPGYVTAFAAGETLPRRLLADPTHHAAILRGLAAALAHLHKLDPAQFSFLAELPESGDAIAALRQRLDVLEEPHPALELGLRWLERNAPPQRRVLLHGDFRNGNVMIDGARITALLDWECAHLGSEAEDLGWLCTRSWRFGAMDKHAGGFGTRRELLDAYADAGGRNIEEDEVRWWERFGLARWGMYNVLQGYGHVHGRASPAYAACGRNAALMEYDLLMSISGRYD
ncbi:MAG: phosphotransferase family protein [Hyphomonadaceae bacterium]|nr:phosphotransferase family protein [Hyphomonadaceae bacterium]